METLTTPKQAHTRNKHFSAENSEHFPIGDLSPSYRDGLFCARDSEGYPIFNAFREKTQQALIKRCNNHKALIQMVESLRNNIDVSTIGASAKVKSKWGYLSLEASNLLSRLEW